MRKISRILPASEASGWENSYPVSSARFTDKFRPAGNLSGVRDNSLKATLPLYRTEENAPPGAQRFALPFHPFFYRMR